MKFYLENESLASVPQGSLAFMKLRATSRTPSNTKNYLFDTDFLNNVIIISSGYLLY